MSSLGWGLTGLGVGFVLVVLGLIVGEKFVASSLDSILRFLGWALVIISLIVLALRFLSHQYAL